VNNCDCDANLWTLAAICFHIATAMMFKAEATGVQMVRKVVAAVERDLFMNLAVAVEGVVCMSSQCDVHVVNTCSQYFFVCI